MNRPDDGSKSWSDLFVREASRHGPLYYSIAFRLLKDAARAEDACQQAMTAVWARRHDGIAAGALRAYLVRSVVNQCFQELRGRRVERRVLPLVGRQADVSDDPAHGVELRETVQAALAELAEPTRTIVVLRLMEGLAGQEVKEILGCSASEVSRRLHQGVEQLRAILGPGGGVAS